jgi:transcriptional regulator with XRE-family HTH domain
MDSRAQIREFLVSRRERISPAQAGLPAYGGNRRVKGLRREEVALLAGVSTDYYVRMERGNLAGASNAVLDGIANALQLDEAERTHLFDLARAAWPSPPRQRRTKTSGVTGGIQQILDAITDAPAWVRNARHDMLAANRMARALYAPLFADPRRPVNNARFVYLDPAARDFFTDWERSADDIAAMLRSEAGRNPRDKQLIELIGELSTRSEDFRARRARPQRPVSPNWPQAAPPPRRRCSGPRLRGHGVSRPPRAHPARLHRSGRQPRRRQPETAG